MRKFGLLVATGLTFSTACSPALPGLDLGTSDPDDGAVGRDEKESGVRILSDVTPPRETDASPGRDGGGRPDARDATPADHGEDGFTDDDAPPPNDVAIDPPVPEDAKGFDAPVVGSDGPSDAKNTKSDASDVTRPADAATDATDAADAADGEADAPIVLGDCAEVRACVRSAIQTEAACLRSASAAARASAEPVLACEVDACATPCRAAYALSSCNACLLQACPAALVACARQSGCGDGVVANLTEECDDGNDEAGDACTTACTRARCGDGIVRQGQEAGITDPDEECDEGAANGDDAPCLPTCRVNRCGDGKTCRGEGCGARLGTLLEQCDDGNIANDDDCVTACRAATCGDGYVHTGVETCDDGNDDPFDGCGHCAPAASHLLITEVVTRPVGSEFVEILNPTRYTVALADYWFSDSHLYYAVASGTFTTASGTDFAARFPDGAVLEPGHYAVIALGNASGGTQSFSAVYGKAPDFELRPTANQAADDPAVPNMIAVGASIGANTSLTDGGEPVVLFSFRGGDLVSDVDYLFYGSPSTSNPMVDKTGVLAGASSYLPDTPASAQHAVAAPGEAGSIHRCVYAESHETPMQGNGIVGHDETSEDGTAAFRLSKTAAERTPGAPPPAGVCNAAR